MNVDLSCEVNCMALFGPSGSGKTTILSSIAGTFTPDNARVSINKKVVLDTEQKIIVPPEKRFVGVTPQHSLLFEHMNVRKNLEFGMPKKRKWKLNFLSSNKKMILFDDVVDVLGLSRLLDRYPEKLSGGERQRIAVGRALLSQPELLILDEPLSALDESLKGKIIEYLRLVIDHWHIPTIIITHSRSVVHKLADFVVIINNGTIIDSGSPYYVLPENLRFHHDIYGDK